MFEMMVKDLIVIAYGACIMYLGYKFGYKRGRIDEQLDTYEELLNVLAEKDVIEIKDGIEALNEK